jgi:hypothetical protein
LKSRIKAKFRYGSINTLTWFLCENLLALLSLVC